MNSLKSASLAFVLLALSSSAALAQMTSGGSAPASGPGAMTNGSAMTSGSMTNSSSGMSSMSKTDTKTMKSCQAMSHDAMMGSAKCKTLMAKHPDMFNSDGTMKTDPMAPPR